MSCVVLLAPALTGIALPVLAAAASAVAAAMGFKIASKLQGQTLASTAVEDSGKSVKVNLEHGGALAETLGMEESIVMEKAGVTVTIRRSASGQAEIEARGKLPDLELKAIGEEVSKSLVQAVVRAKVEAEAKARGYSLAEEKSADGTIKLRFIKRG